MGPSSRLSLTAKDRRGLPYAASVRLTEFWQRMEHHLGSAYAASWARDQVLGSLGGRTAQEALDDLVAKVTADIDVTARAVVVPGTTPARTLLEQAGARDGLLAVGSRGRGGFLGRVLGSVSLQCLQYGALPVVVVHG